ncbi:MAG TPA: hypothetical protein VM802_29430 [Chitinophaga sp.]|uniref:hypothetical protein n=1 Tax=Chitinophaga sp. TaxID=1869181 RepID=UPI002C5EF43A|nr:hypothetical protein [Chitinophaga sp.]HVI49024.1 hypothetical protein [Chitinophaga sp.]
MQQHYSFSSLEKFIHVDLQQASHNQQQPDEHFFAEAVSRIVNEKWGIVEGIPNSLHDLESEEQVCWLVQQSQQRLVMLMDQVAKHLDAESLLGAFVAGGKGWPDLYKITYDNLTTLLTYFEQMYERYLNIDCKIPPCYLLKAQRKFEQDEKLLKEGFISSDVDEQLQKIIFMPFLGLLDENYLASKITYRQLHYLTEMNKQLFILLDAHEEKMELSEKLHGLLLCINFNSFHYFEYWMSITTTELQNLPAFREKLDRLSYLQKIVNQAFVKPALAYNMLQPSLQNKIQSWLSEEIAYHKETYAASDGTYLPNEFSRRKGFKVQTAFSVPQLANMLKLLFDNGFFLNKNRGEVLDFFSCFFTSVKQGSISPSSLRNNFYNGSAAVSKSVRDILMKLVNQSRKGLNVVACLVLACFF